MTEEHMLTETIEDGSDVNTLRVEAGKDPLPDYQLERRWPTFAPVVVDTERLRCEIADALDIAAPYVDIYEDRIEVVGAVDPDDPEQCAAVQQVIDAHDPTPPPADVTTVAEVRSTITSSNLAPNVKAAFGAVLDLIE